MKALRFVGPSVALIAALVLSAPTNLRGFTVNGGLLALDQRSVRVFDNFTDTTANNNVTPDSNWLGAQGATMAIWKAASEWASELHNGTGAGDPLQTIGSGGANFDFAWGGLADGVGGTNDNIVSQISGGSGAILAFTEIPVTDGWRTRFYALNGTTGQPWPWQDGPANFFVGVDIQAVATHELGHALGLGHSNDPNATMFATINGTGVAVRSIEADDVAGVQSLYGARSPSKPHIASVSGTTTLTITGSNFSPTGNEVWFTSAAPSAASAYATIKLTGVSSTNGGTLIVVNTPPNAGRGDVLVRNANGATGADLSNAFVADAQASSTCGTTTIYCTAKVNSQGCTPMISAAGIPSTSSPAPFWIGASRVLNNKNGLLFYSFHAGGAAFEGGFLCCKSPIVRTALQNAGGSASGADCSGNYAYDFNARIRSGADPQLVAAAIVFAQYWSRDPSDPTGFTTGLTDALTFAICQ